MDDEPSTRRSRRAVLGLAAGALAGVAGCTSEDDGIPRMGNGSDGRNDESPSSPDDPDPSKTPGTPGSPEGTPAAVDPGALRLTGASVQSSALRRHIMGGFLSVWTTEDWLLFVSLGTGEATPDDTERAFQRRPGYPEHGALELRIEGGRDVAYGEVRERNYRLAGDARGAWTAFAVPSGTDAGAATVVWPAEGVEVGEVPAGVLDRLARQPPSFTLTSFVAGDPGTTPGPTPHGSPTPNYDDFPTTTVDYELRVRNEGGAGTFRGFLDHETPKERFIADYSQGGDAVTAAFAAGETRTLTGEYRVYHREDDPVVPVRAVTPGGEATSYAATGE